MERIGIPSPASNRTPNAPDASSGTEPADTASVTSNRTLNALGGGSGTRFAMCPRLNRLYRNQQESA